ncbi:MAG: DMT family transporter [Alphaproteobacteria bacterium]
MITVLAFLFLNETIGFFRWTAVACGLIGTLMIVQPFGAEFRIAYLIPLSSAIFYASFAIMTKVLGKTEATETLVFYSLSGFLLTSGLVGVVFGSGFASPDDGGALSFMLRAWKIPEQKDLLFLTVICFSTAGISICLSMAYKIGEASLLAPFEYVVLPISLLMGYFVWKDFPNALALSGMTIILFAGIVVAIRELTKNKTPASNPGGLVGQAVEEE